MLSLSADVCEKQPPIREIGGELRDLDVDQVDVVLNSLFGQPGLELRRKDDVLVSLIDLREVLDLERGIKGERRGRNRKR